ncbi:MAG: hypothetical protein JEZ12_28245 [Desulfobacterium sp.]|nr:hypothetical protein [Desulfobacterium sp.]
MKDEKALYFQKEIAPLFDSEQILMEKAMLAYDENELKEALIYTDGVLILNPENQEAQNLFEEINETMPKSLALDFIRKFYPRQISLFDNAWAFLQDLNPLDLGLTQPQEGLGLANSEEIKKSVLFQSILFFKALPQFDEEVMSSDNLQTEIEKICSDLSISKNLTKDLLKFLRLKADEGN